MISFLSFDTETTGFDKNARIFEIAIIYFEDGKVVDTLSSRFNPPVDWEDPGVKQASSVNGITKDQLEGCPAFEALLVDIKKAFGREKLWVAHNAKFDLRMIEQEVQRCGEPGRLTELIPGVRVMCTMELDKRISRLSKGIKMCDTAPRWGVELVNAHTAEADALACGQVFYKMLKMGKLPGDVESQLRSIGSLPPPPV